MITQIDSFLFIFSVRKTAAKSRKVRVAKSQLLKYDVDEEEKDEDDRHDKQTNKLMTIYEHNTYHAGMGGMVS